MEAGCVSPTWKLVVSETSPPSQRASLCPTYLPRWSCLSSILLNSSLLCFRLPPMLLYLTSQIISTIPESSFSPPSPERFSYFWCPLLTSTLEPDTPLSTLVITVVPLHWGLFWPPASISGRCSQLSSFLHTPPPQLCGSKPLLRLCFPLLIHIRRWGLRPTGHSLVIRRILRDAVDGHSEIIQFYRGNKVRLKTQVAGWNQAEKWHEVDGWE